MADLQKRLEKAEKYLQKGKPQDALEQYLEILEDDPNNDAVRTSAADVAMTVGENEQAAELLSTLFDRQSAIGDQVKSVANYKKLARLGQPTVDQTFKFAQFIEKADKRQALEEYETCVKKFTEAGRKDDALNALKKITALEGSAANHKRIAELAEQLRDLKAAAA